MSIGEQLDKLETAVAGGRVPGTSRTLVNMNAVNQLISEIRGSLPEHVNEAEAVLRQKDGIIKQAELEARRIRAYADEEAMTIRQLAEEQSAASLEPARQQARGMVMTTEIVKAAEEESAGLLRRAEETASQVVADAEAEAERILSTTFHEADERRRGADNYAREVLFHLEERIADTLGQVRSGIDTLDSRDPQHGAMASVN